MLFCVGIRKTSKMDTIFIQKEHFLLFFFNLALAFPVNDEAHVKNCTIHPFSSTLPCVQYSFEGSDTCLRQMPKWFPNLYRADKENLALWPAEPTNIHRDVQGAKRNITWKGPMNGSLRFLKGFQIILEGKSMESFGRTLCSVVYLTDNNTDTMISLLMNATFELMFDAPGDFDLEIKSLPLPGKIYEQPPSADYSMTDSHEYHPNISLDISAEQLNSSFANVSVDIILNSENISSFLLEALFDSNDLLDIPELITATISGEKNYAVLGNLRTGNYTLKLRPKNEFPWDRSKCVCFTGLPIRKSCTPCRPYVTYLEIQPLTENISKTLS